MKTRDIAIVGMGCVAPGAVGTERFWSNVLEGNTYFGPMPRNRWDSATFVDRLREDPTKAPTAVGAFVPEFEFPFSDYKLPPKLMTRMDRAQIVALECARQALADAGIAAHGAELERAGTVLGTCGVDGYAHSAAMLRRNLFCDAFDERLEAAGVPKFRRDAMREQFQYELESRGHRSDLSLSAIADAEASLSNRVAQTFGAHGFNLTVDAACASSLAAVEIAVHALQAGDLDVALAGGVDLAVNPAVYVGFSRMGALSPGGSSLPFDARADGIVLGEGGGIVVLKRLEDALSAGNRIHAVIRGIGSASDGAGSSLFHPSRDGRIKALTEALKDAELSPREVQYVECHATSTTLGDAAEYDALASVQHGLGRDEPLRLGSIKYQIGHTKAAAGAVGLIKTALAMGAGTFPHMPRFRRLNCEVTTPSGDLYIPGTVSPWLPHPDGRRIAGVSASGIGGANYHLVMEHRRAHLAPSSRRTPGRDVAIVAASVHVPGAATQEEFWDRATQDGHLFDEPHEQADLCPATTGYPSLVCRMPSFDLDARRYRVPPSTQARTSTTQRLAVELAGRLWDAHASGPGSHERVATCIGAMHNDGFGRSLLPLLGDEYRAAMSSTPGASELDASVLESALQHARQRLREIQPSPGADTLPGWMNSCVSGRVSNAFDLRGTNLTIDSACSSGLAAIMVATHQLMFGNIDLVVAGGLNCSQNVEMCHATHGIGAVSGERPRPYDAKSNGFVAGEGGVLFLVKRLHDAERDGDEIQGIIRACCGSSEAASRSMVAPTFDAISKAIRRATETAGVPKGTLAVVEGHGSGNALSDIIEARAVGSELAAEGEGPPVILTSIKSRVGHLYGGAGPIGVLGALMALRSGVVPAVSGLRVVRPEIAALSHHVIPAVDPEPLPHDARFGGVLSLGLGGANYFLILEVPEDQKKPPATEGPVCGCDRQALHPRLLSYLRLHEPEALPLLRRILDSYNATRECPTGGLLLVPDER